ncbi:VanZ family protein, partial [Streptomyces sp. NPDC059456]|uniref:VanZ family protein n=1 Tax=Streptomyces sp. NPDC059456 TaxID=3346838 RepID=UPI0036AD298E
GAPPPPGGGPTGGPGAARGGAAPNGRRGGGRGAARGPGRGGAPPRIGEGLALLAPLGVLLPLVNGSLAPSPLAAWSSLGRTAAAGVLVSLSIEMLQSAVPGRVVDVDSVLLNALGVVLAHVAVVPALRARMRRSRRSQRASQGSTPRIPRVGLGPWTEVLSAVPREY